jgi:hypothetical protein
MLNKHAKKNKIKTSCILVGKYLICGKRNPWSLGSGAPKRNPLEKLGGTLMTNKNQNPT